ncbi:MAG: four helix bundle protein [Bacteroidia bacterium]|jgi:four helix bundle protein|nr:four helix bundle protein [Bacteroidia bacterium]
MNNYKNLNIWSSSMSLVIDTYDLVKNVNRVEKFGLIDQIKRSCVSIPSNIAEGSSRPSIKEFQRYLDISLGSAFELETQLILVKKLYDIESKEIFSALSILQKQIHCFKKCLK